MNRVKHAQAFGRVAVMMGGDSEEREISLMSGQAVLKALLAQNVDAIAFDPAQRSLLELEQESVDRVWIALHGSGGEDGVMQGALETLRLPYTGSGVLGCALSMDKARSKALMLAAGLRTPRYSVFTRQHSSFALDPSFSFPVIVKPNTQGSSVGMTKVDQAKDFVAAVNYAFESSDSVLVEEWVVGSEYTASFLQDEPLPLIRIETSNTFYDYQAKYFSDSTKYFCPSGLSGAMEQKLIGQASRAYRALAVCGWGRVDFMVVDDEAYFLEVNTVPGMTEHSLVPMAAKQVNVGFDELVWKILETSMSEAAPEAARGVAHGA